ncbi:uncharacterized protein TrAtP1_008826 [Trichoderma atroviride]|uniref:uncharacterized protein n=1 Tax=Hypocrea atroviridis TaxID=63577 RepID=UPI003331CAF4|nr:hypothetical protein TrAtP1_008826 [Trichoderma atroviride]
MFHTLQTPLSKAHLSFWIAISDEPPNTIHNLASHGRMARSKWLVACKEYVALQTFNLETTQMKQTTGHHACCPQSPQIRGQDNILSTSTADLHGKLQPFFGGRIILASARRTARH